MYEQVGICSSMWISVHVMSMQLVKVTKSFLGSNAENSITEGELLVVKNMKSKITGMSKWYSGYAD